MLIRTPPPAHYRVKNIYVYFIVCYKKQAIYSLKIMICILNSIPQLGLYSPKIKFRVEKMWSLYQSWEWSPWRLWMNKMEDCLMPINHQGKEIKDLNLVLKGFIYNSFKEYEHLKKIFWKLKKCFVFFLLIYRWKCDFYRKLSYIT